MTPWKRTDEQIVREKGEQGVRRMSRV